MRMIRIQEIWLGWFMSIECEWEWFVFTLQMLGWFINIESTCVWEWFAFTIHFVGRCLNRWECKWECFVFTMQMLGWFMNIECKWEWFAFSPDTGWHTVWHTLGSHYVFGWWMLMRMRMIRIQLLVLGWFMNRWECKWEWFAFSAKFLRLLRGETKSGRKKGYLLVNW